jgi:hypothetical protein
MGPAWLRRIKPIGYVSLPRHTDTVPKERNSSKKKREKKKKNGGRGGGGGGGGGEESEI